MTETTHIDTTSHDGYERTDFVTPGNNEGFQYPFRATPEDFSKAQNAEWEGSLDESCRGEDGIYREHGFNFEQAVSALPGPILEVGGPSTSGYDFLDDVDLPSKPIMTNFAGSRPEFRGAESLTPIDALVLDALVDVRALPFADESLGMVMCSSMPQADQQVFREIATTLPPEQQGAATNAAIEKSYKEAEAAVARDDSKFLRRHGSPVVAAIAQAERTLKPNGLLVMHNLGPRDARIAEALGLELVMHTPMAEAGTMQVIREAAFRKIGAKE
jgi:hypothetical protein